MTNSSAAAAVYCRISRDPSGRALGVDRQERACRKLAKQRGWTVHGVYVDNDTSAYSGKRRPSYERMLADVKDGTVQAIVALHPDRLHRSPRELETFIDLLDAHSVTVATVRSGDYDLSTASGRMSARIVGAVARGESERMSERIRDQKQDAARQGKPNGGGRTFGYTAQFEIVPKEAAAIRDAVTRLLDGEGTKSIARRWNTKGLRAAKGGEWTPQSVKQCLMAPRLAGLRVHRGEVVGTGQWEPIITRDDHERVVAHFSARRTGVGRPPTTLLGGGLLRCGLCETGMQSAGTRYECRAGTGLPGCGQVSVSKAAIEKYVADEMFGHPLAVQARGSHPGSGKAVADVGKRIAATECRLDQLAEDYATGTLTRRAYLAGQKAANDQLNELRSQVATTEATRALAPFRAEGLLQARWPTLDRHERRRILDAVFEKITVHPSRTGPVFSPDRVELRWREQ